MQQILSFVLAPSRGVVQILPVSFPDKFNPYPIHAARLHDSHQPTDEIFPVSVVFAILMDGQNALRVFRVRYSGRPALLLEVSLGEVLAYGAADQFAEILFQY